MYGPRVPTLEAVDPFGVKRIFGLSFAPDLLPLKNCESPDFGSLASRASEGPERSIRVLCV